MWNREALDSTVKRYHLFSGIYYYPSAGLGDYVGSYLTEKDALRSAANQKDDWWYIVFTEADGSLVILDSGPK